MTSPYLLLPIRSLLTVHGCTIEPVRGHVPTGKFRKANVGRGRVNSMVDVRGQIHVRRILYYRVRDERGRVVEHFLKVRPAQRWAKRRKEELSR
jgi:hypothetical protein